MRTHGRAGGAPLLLAPAVFALLVGCGPSGRYAVRPPPSVPAGAGELLPLRVELRVPEEYGKDYSNKRWFGGIREIQVDFGDGLKSGAEATARSVFETVVTAAPEAGQAVDAVLVPRLALVSWFRGVTLGTPMETVMDLEWRLTAGSSTDLVWAGTARGVGKGTMQTIQEQLDTALAEAFRESARQMTAAPEVKAFAQGAAARR